MCGRGVRVRFGVGASHSALQRRPAFQPDSAGKSAEATASGTADDRDAVKGEIE